MAIKLSLFDKQLPIDSISLELKNGSSAPLDILRLDQIHETISGNKWFKLKHNLLAAEKLGGKRILSFGGAYSNHLHALAYAGKIFNIKTIGIVRGEEVANPTLNDCKAWGMELQFISRAAYKEKTEVSFLQKLQKDHPNSFIIPEGGDNELGQKGCEEILKKINIKNYDILCCSIGTGTTISGLASSFKTETGRPQLWGFAPFKNAHSLKEKLTQSIPELNYIDDYHFDGFGKISAELTEFSDSFLAKHDIALDKIYTAKMFFGLMDILNSSSLWDGKKILVVHTGGLQGNRSSNS